MSVRCTVAVFATLLLIGCDTASDDDLQAWMEGVRKRQHAAPVAAVPERIAAAFSYDDRDRPDPFDPARLSPTDDLASAVGMVPDLQRTREPLEAYALESLRLVGSLRRGREVVALVEADRLIHQVRLGSHLGQDFGKVVAIGDNGIDIDELVRDSGGGWSRRRAQLNLQERR
jgi:type IV pilus assembly protein PilP